MAALALSFLGPFSVTLHDQLLTRFESDKVRALLIYLAIEAGKPHRRSALAGLIWPNSPESAARACLRNALADLRQMIQDQSADPPYLRIDRESIQMNLSSDHWLDVRAFEERLDFDDQLLINGLRALRIENFKSAAALYHGAFLEGFSLKDSPEFEQWALVMRENLHHKAVSVLSRLALEFEQAGDFDQACAYALRLVALEPAHEATHRQIMRLLAQNGQRAAALAQYEACRRILADDLCVQPEETTITLYQQIRDGRFKPCNRQSPSHNLPSRLSGLVGREAELKTLLARLGEPSCQALTVTGPGGCGKTRFAVEAAYRMVDHFQNGIYFVNLAGIQTPAQIPQAIAQSLDFLFRPDQEPWQQVVDYLREKQALLILDNFEHVLAGAGLVVELLRAARNVKILVTSRVRLNFMKENVFPLGGLEYPPEANGPGPTEALATCPAVQLFLEGAQRVKPGFAPGAAEFEQIASICRAVTGNPLAVLLSASWVGLLAPAEISMQIQQHTLDFLETSWLDLPERQRSLRVVLDHSWVLLNNHQRELVAGLSVFPGSFIYQSAKAVADIGLKDLRDLVDRSIVQMTSSARFELHMLLRQYTAGKLASMPGKREQFLNRFCTYFMDLLVEWAMALQGHEQQDALQRIVPEVENIRLAWQLALDHAPLDHLAAALDGLGGMYEQLCLYQEGEALFQHSIMMVQAAQKKASGAPLDAHTAVPLLARMFAWQSLFSRLSGNNSAAHQAVCSGLEMLDGLPATDCPGFAEKAFLLFQRAHLLYDTDREQSLRDMMESLVIYRKVGNAWREAQVLTSLALITSARGHYQRAEAYLAESLAIQRRLGDTTGMAATLSKMSFIMIGVGDFSGVTRFVQEHAALLGSIHSPAQLAENLNFEGSLLCFLGRFPESAGRFEETIALNENLGNRTAVMVDKSTLGWVEVNQGFYDQGDAHYRDSLSLARDLGDLRGISMNLFSLGEIYLVRAEYDQALRVIAESIQLFQQVFQDDEYSIALADLADVEYQLGMLDPAEVHLQQALDIAAETGSWQASVYVVGKAALFLARQGEIERGVEMYALATHYPYLENSRYWEDTAGKHIVRLAARLPDALVRSAQERGRARELSATVNELRARLRA